MAMALFQPGKLAIDDTWCGVGGARVHDTQ
jgi:hypothetical protein